MRSEHQAAAIEHLRERGYVPKKVEPDGNGLIVLIFSPLPDDQLYGLVQALPLHLSAKVGIILGGKPPFSPDYLKAN